MLGYLGTVHMQWTLVRTIRLALVGTVHCSICEWLVLIEAHRTLSALTWGQCPMTDSQNGHEGGVEWASTAVFVLSVCL